MRTFSKQFFYFILLLLSVHSTLFAIVCDTTEMDITFSDLLARGIHRNPITNAITLCGSRENHDFMLIFKITYDSIENIYNVNLTDCPDYENQLFGATPVQSFESNEESYCFHPNQQLEKEYLFQKNHLPKLISQRKFNIAKRSNGNAYYQMPMDSFRIKTNIKFENNLNCPSECTNIYMTFYKTGKYIYSFQMVGYHEWALIDIFSEHELKCYNIEPLILTKPNKKTAQE